MSDNKNDLKEPLNKNFREPKIAIPNLTIPWFFKQPEKLLGGRMI